MYLLNYSVVFLRDVFCLTEESVQRSGRFIFRTPGDSEYVNFPSSELSYSTIY